MRDTGGGNNPTRRPAHRYRLPGSCVARAAFSPRRRLAGDFNLRLAGPGAGNNGRVLVTTAVPTSLRLDWNGAVPGYDNPAGQATFGIYNGEQWQIYTREIY